MNSKFLATCVLLGGLAAAENLTVTTALKQQITGEARDFSGKSCTTDYIVKKKTVLSLEFAKIFIQGGQQAIHQPGFNIIKEKLSQDGLTYQFYGTSSGNNLFMKTFYDTSATSPTILYHICTLK
ncbi:hypothetical protein GCM10022631_12690 [Deinococcus rubellus]|uniref:Uncharacterized protein n=1 Tax=Deinococcus rubellus TaxID=1889240 RepID=A0ABY5YE37_9DEIO|nr:hypothetical protein [Deinococcus rubellus]UWX63304.1 hypothetical protein N0D28_11160 [Deinococcus rubellus]